MAYKSFFFAGGGTAGHIYPALAIAQKLIDLEPDSEIHFFCSQKPVDFHVLSKTTFSFTQLSAKGLSFKPGPLFRFCKTFYDSYSIAKKKLISVEDPSVIGVGGFIAAPVCFAGHRLKIPVKLLNIDIVPGRANKLITRWADEIYVQFRESTKYFGSSSAKVIITGCPLRSGFFNTKPKKAIEKLKLNKDKKILLITGASSGSSSINEAVGLLLEKLSVFNESWQIVHLTGLENKIKVMEYYKNASIAHKVIDYYDDMPDLIAASELLIGRSGAVSVAEYTALAIPAICLPYPHHKDRHQYLNAAGLIEAGAAVIVDDLPNPKNRAERLWTQLNGLMRDDKIRQKMRQNYQKIGHIDATSMIAERLIQD